MRKHEKTVVRPRFWANPSPKSRSSRSAVAPMEQIPPVACPRDSGRGSSLDDRSLSAQIYGHRHMLSPHAIRPVHRSDFVTPLL